MSSDRFGGRAGLIAHFSSTKSVIFICDFLLDLAVFKDPESGFEPQNERILVAWMVQTSVCRFLEDPANCRIPIAIWVWPKQLTHGQTHARTEHGVFFPGTERRHNAIFQIRPLGVSFPSENGRRAANFPPLELKGKLAAAASPTVGSRRLWEVFIF